MRDRTGKRPTPCSMARETHTGKGHTERVLYGLPACNGLRFANALLKKGEKQM